MRLFSRRDSAVLGGKFTSGRAWFAWPLTSAGPVPKSAHTSLMMSSLRCRCAAVNTGWRYLVRKTR